LAPSTGSCRPGSSMPGDDDRDRVGVSRALESRADEGFPGGAPTLRCYADERHCKQTGFGCPSVLPGAALSPRVARDPSRSLPRQPSGLMTPRRTSRPTVDTPIRCKHCRKPIRNVDQLQLLQSCDSTPESGTGVTVHTSCADAFIATHPGTWERYSGRSSSAGWFLPMMVRWPDAPAPS